MNRRYNILTLIAVFMAILQDMPVQAVPAYPRLQSYRQPDGCIVQYRMRGDEYCNWIESDDGYILQKAPDGYLVYAGIEDSRITPTEHIYRGGKTAVPENLNRIKAADMKKGKRNSQFLIGETFPMTGKRKLLMLLVNFADTETHFDSSEFDRLMNEKGYNGTGSFRDFYLENSYGQLDIETTVTEWIRLPRNKNLYSTEDMTQLITDALTAVSGQIDISQFDNDGDGELDGLSIIHQGTGQEVTGSTADIWSHSGELTDVYAGGIKVGRYTIQPELLLDTPQKTKTTVGVLCHEFGHNLGAPDFYDVDYETGGLFSGTGEWDLMAEGIWLAKEMPGDSPSHINMWQKIQFGWVTPVTLSETCTIDNMTPASENPEAYIVNTTRPGDYYVLEHRSRNGFDRMLEGEGLIVYHADETRIAEALETNMVNAGYMQGLYTVCASAGCTPGSSPASFGDINSSGTPFPGTGNITEFSDTSLPAMHSNDGKYSYSTIRGIELKEGKISFDFITGDVPETVREFGVTSIHGTVTLAWQKPQSDDVECYRIFRDEILLAETKDTSYQDTDLKEKQAAYKIDVKYQSGLFSPFVEKTIRKPSDLINEIAYEQEENSIRLQWGMTPSLTRIEGGQEDVEFGYVTEKTFDVAQKFTAADLKTFNGYEISEISFLPFTSQRTTQYRICVWRTAEGGNTPEIVSERDASEYASGQTRTMKLKTPVVIEPGYDYLIGIHVETIDAAVRVVCDGKSLNKEKGNLVYAGGEWHDDMLPYNSYITAGLTTKEKDNSFVAGENPEFSESYDPVEDMYYPIGFNVYRDGKLIGYSSTRTFVDTDMAEGTHTYEVACLYEGNNEAAPQKIKADYCGVEENSNATEAGATACGMTVTISTPCNAGAAIYDTAGNIVWRGACKKGKTVYRLENKGIYIVKIWCENNIATNKIIAE